MAVRMTALVSALIISAAALAACDNGPSAVAKKSAASEVASTNGATPAAPLDSAGRVDHRKDPVPELDGKPMWAASRRASAEDNAQKAFDRNGEAFGAKNLDSFVRKAHAFVDHPPKGVQTLTRTNGDTLFYDPKGNIFAVADKAGTPRTMFKPDDGADYWQKQKDREAKRQTARVGRSERTDEAG